MIGIIDYGVGNLAAFKKAYEILDIPSFILNANSDIKRASHFIIPGVGSFDNAITRFREVEFFNELFNVVIDQEIPVLGVCIGMHIMFDNSAEGKLTGLGWIPGQVEKFIAADRNNLSSNFRVPHIGWNTINSKKKSNLIDGLESEEFYFLHSYYCSPTKEADVIATTSYYQDFSSVVQFRNFYGTQFHPEKSHTPGLKILENFSKI